ncbi:Hypothetical protein PBC10988_12960 [Planctomycetales bacterium 10988]|nr:Hypothetical protein PBC10988_12960 [Planctomycetales bacterium 10988]
MESLDYAWFAGWWNLIFLLPFFVALIYMVLYAATGISFGEALESELEAAAEAEMETAELAEVEAPAEVEANGEMETASSVEAEPSTMQHYSPVMDNDMSINTAMSPDYDQETGPDMHLTGTFESIEDYHPLGNTPLGQENPSTASVSSQHHPLDAAETGAKMARERVITNPWLRGLMWLGVGKTPLSILLALLCFLWTAIGFSVNVLLATNPLTAGAVEHLPAVVVFFSLPLAMFGSLLGTHYLAEWMGHLVPTTYSSAQKRRQMTGITGTAVFAIDDKFGLAQIRARDGGLQQIQCRTYPDREPLPKNSTVLTVDYDEEGGFYWVVRGDLPDE